MKRFVCFLLILCIFPFVSFAEDPDPIIGLWYVVYDINQYSEKVQNAFQQNIHIRDTFFEVHVLWFTENGEIYKSVTNFRTSQSEAKGAAIIGTWRKEESGKYTTVISSTISHDSSYIEDGILYAKYLSDYYIAFRKMDSLNFSTELRKK